MAENASNGPSAAGPAAAAKAPAPAQARQVAAQAAQRSKPGKLPGKLAADLGQSLGGHDMDGVDVHTDAAAAEAAGALNAKAFAVGKAMFFGEGQYNPDSKDGQHLIAHEAAHTVQQSGSDAGIPQLASMDVSSPGDKHEVEAESFADTFSKGGKGSVSPVSKGSVSRSIIQRDLLDGKGPEIGPPVPINAHEASPSDLTHGAAEAIKNARAAGGTNAVVAKVHELRNGANDKTRNAVESAISSTLTEDEKNALDGKTSQAPAAGAQTSSQPAGAPQNKTPEQKPAGQKASDKPGADNGAGGADPASEDKGAGGGGKGGDKHDGKGAQGDAKHAAAGTGGTHKPEGGKDAPAPAADHEGGGDHEHHQPHVPEAAGRELIEQELAFHEKWAVYANGGAGARAGSLLKGLVTTDAVEGGKGALTQVLMGQGMKLAVTKTALGKIPGVGNIIGGAFSAYNLFSNGGAGIKKMGGEAIEGIGGAFSAQNWKESPWLTAANLVAGIQATLELIGNVCQILSGLAYAFAAIAALGGLLSIFFPPLAFLVPYIPTAINFGRACGGIATVCFSVASLISPISPLLRAIHLIFSNQDPIKLVEEDKKFHEQAQGAMANYAAATANSAIDSKGKSFNPVNKMLGEVHEGADAAKESMHKGAVKEVGEDMQMPEMELKGAKDKAMAGGVKENLPGNHADKAADANKIGKDYFNPDERAKPLEDNVKKQEDRLKTTEDTAHRREAELDKAKEKLADDNNRPNRRAVQNAERRLEKAEGKVAAAEAAKEDAEGHLAVGGRNNAGGAQGNVGDTSNGARGRMNENGEEKKVETAAEAYNELREGQEPVEPTKNAKGHIELPEPPGSLKELEDMDKEIENLRKQEEAAKKTATDAKQTATQAKTVQGGLTNAAAGVQAKVQGEQQRGAQKQAQVTAQTQDMQAKTAQAHGTTAGGTQRGAGVLGGIASSARVVDGILQRVPSNKFFDISSTKNNVHKFVVGMDQITGAPGEQQKTQAQTQGAVQQRGQQQQEAAAANAGGVQAGNQLHGKMTQDASSAASASAQATEVAQSATQKGNEAQQTSAQLQQKRQAKWSALLAWAAKHRAIRESAAHE